MYTLQPVKKTGIWFKILAIVGAIFLGVFACGAFLMFVPTSSTGLGSSSTSHEVAYRITVGDCTEFGVTYSLPNGTSQKDVTACRGQDYVDGFFGEYGDYLYLSAQNQGSSNNQTPFSCVIEVDGRRIATVQSIGFASIASCSGTLR